MAKWSLLHGIFLSMILGVMSGFLIESNTELWDWLLLVANFTATIFLRLLKMIIVPLVVSSLISGVTKIGSHRRLRTLGVRTLSYYVSTSMFAILTGLILVNIIQPGIGVDLGLEGHTKPVSTSMKQLVDVFIRMVPENVLQSATKGQMLPIIFFSLFFGLCIMQIGKEGSTHLVQLFNSLYAAMIRMTHLVLYVAPLGIWALFTKLVATSGFSSFVPLAWYALTVFLALLIHASVTLPLILLFVAKVKPWKIFMHMRYALLTAFSTASSSATLPLTMENIERNARVSNKVSSFTLPLGATVNMDGTALYECVAVIFISQVYGIQLGLAQQTMVVLTALLASIGAAGIPMAGLVMMSIVLTAVGLPLEGVGIIIAVDRILDMCRTTVNVWSDSCGAVVIARMEGEKIS